jgi:hypothetical protein
LLTGFISFRVFPWIPWPSSQAGSRPELSADAVFKVNAYIALPEDSLQAGAMLSTTCQKDYDASPASH